MCVLEDILASARSSPPALLQNISSWANDILTQLKLSFVRSHFLVRAERTEWRSLWAGAGERTGGLPLQGSPSKQREEPREGESESRGWVWEQTVGRGEPRPAAVSEEGGQP